MLLIATMLRLSLNLASTRLILSDGDAGARPLVAGRHAELEIRALLGAADHDATKVKTTETQYRDAIERDGFVVTIETTEDKVDHASNALAAAGATDISVLREHGDSPRTVTLRHED